MITRKHKITEHISIDSGVGLELGPLTRPTLTKDEAKILYCDHLSTPELKKKYKDEPVDSSKLVRVDFALEGKSLREAVGKKRFDYVIASHVIEHIPDIVSWFYEISEILTPGGVLSLVVPDKRYTFDILRNVSSPADVVGAYFDKLDRFTSAAMYDFAFSARADINPTQVWDKPLTNFGYKKTIYNRKKAMSMVRLNANGRKYVDCHCFVFTPFSFFEIVKELIKCDMFDYEVVGFCDTEPGDMEFFVSLKKTTKTSAQKLRTVPELYAPKEVRELQLRINALESELNDVLTSTSWVVTRPLRSLKRFFKVKFT